MRPAGKARRPRILDVFEGGATQPAPGSPTRLRVGVEEGCPARKICDELRGRDTRSQVPRAHPGVLGAGCWKPRADG
jgi:hypothetical protein